MVPKSPLQAPISRRVRPRWTGLADARPVLAEHAWSRMFLLLVASLLTGCHRDDRVPVSGTVTIDGHAADYGLVSFRPVDDQQAAGSGASLQGGKFEIPAHQGLRPGSYQVTVQAFRKTGRMLHSEEAGEFPEWTVIPVDSAPLPEATVVARGRPNRFELQLRSARPKEATP